MDPDAGRKREAMGALIRAARHDAKLTQGEAAKAMGVRVTSYQRYEAGVRTTAFEKIADLCRAIKTTPNRLLGFSDKTVDGPNTEELTHITASLLTEFATLSQERPDVMGADGKSPDPSHPYWQGMAAALLTAIEIAEEGGKEKADAFLLGIRHAFRAGNG